MGVDQSFSLISSMSDFEIQNRKKTKSPGNVPVLSLLKDYPQLLRGCPGNPFLLYFPLFFLYFPGNPSTSSQPILHLGVLIDH